MYVDFCHPARIDDGTSPEQRSMDMGRAKEWRSFPSFLNSASNATINVLIGATCAVDSLDQALQVWMEAILGTSAASEINSERGNISLDVEWMKYGSLLRALEDPMSEFHMFGSGAGQKYRCRFLLVRVDDLLEQHPEQRHQTLTKKKAKAKVPPPPKVEELEQAVDTLLALLEKTYLDPGETSAPSGATPTSVLLLPRPPAACVEKTEMLAYRQLEDRIMTRLSPLAHYGLRVSRLHAMDYWKQCLGRKFFYSAELDRLAHSPYTAEGLVLIASYIVRHVLSLLVLPRKVIVLDCDNTLWGGVVGEVGPSAVVLNTSFQRLQELFSALQKQGVLLTLASRNREEDVKAVFELRAQEMRLKWDQIVATKISWQTKSASIQELSQELSLGLDSFFFIDDNPMECYEVISNCPGAVVIQLPSEMYWERIPDFLDSLWPLDSPWIGRSPALLSKDGKGTTTPSLTAEDANRTELYRAKHERERLRKGFSSVSAFLASLNIRIDCEPITRESATRASQLTSRTNQHNARKCVLSVEDLLSMSQSKEGKKGDSKAGGRANHGESQREFEVVTVSSGDRFSFHGMVGLYILRNQVRTLSLLLPDDDSSAQPTLDPRVKQFSCLVVHTFLLSCRALHLGIDYGMLREIAKFFLVQEAEKEVSGGTERVIAIPWVPAERNEPSRVFFKTLPGSIFIPHPNPAELLLSANDEAVSLSLSKVTKKEDVTVSKETISSSTHRSDGDKDNARTKAGISVYLTPQEDSSPVPGVFLIPLQSALEAQLSLESSEHATNSQAEIKEETPEPLKSIEEKERDKDISFPATVVLSSSSLPLSKSSSSTRAQISALSLHSLTYNSIAYALSVHPKLFLRSFLSRMNENLTRSGDNGTMSWRETIHVGHVNHEGNDEEKTEGTDLHLSTMQSLLRLNLSSGSDQTNESKDKGEQIQRQMEGRVDMDEESEDVEEDDIETYQRLWRVRSRLRHEVKKMIQVANPTSYLQHVDLSQEAKGQWDR